MNKAMLARIRTHDKGRHLVHLRALFASETKETECLHCLTELLWHEKENREGQFTRRVDLCRT